MLPEIGIKEQSKKTPIKQPKQPNTPQQTNKQAKDKHKPATLKKTLEV